MNLKDKIAEYKATLKSMRDIAAAAEEEGREFTDDERVDLKAKMGQSQTLKTEIKEAQGDSDLADAIKAMGDDIGLAGDPPELDPVKPGRKGTVGKRFVDSDAYKNFMGQFPNGRIPEQTKGIHSAPVQFKDLLTGADDGSGGAFVQTDYTGIYEPLGRRPLTLLDVISRRQTGSDNVEYVRQVTQSNAAAPVAEATTAAGPTANTTTGVFEDAAGAGVKPEASFTYLKVNEAVKTIAVWVPASKRALSDAAQLMGLIDDELNADLMQELEDQVAVGDGTGENFTGILATSGIQTQAFDTNVFTSTRKARTKVRTVGRSVASAYMFHPNDWEKIDLTQDLEGRYYYGGPAMGGPEVHWKLPVVQSEAVPEGTGLVGDFSKAVLWDREQASIQVSDSHADFFIRNLIAALAEMRGAFGVIRPSAFVTIDLAA